MLTGVHILLTYTCSYECDHCFLHCSPRASGTFTVGQLRSLFDEIDTLGTVTSVYFEGGESFLYYPLLVEGIRLARARDWEVGIVTNGYWATSVEDAQLWLKPLHQLGIADLSVSNDEFHHSGDGPNRAEIAYAAATDMGMSPSTIRIEPATILLHSQEDIAKGEPVIGGDVKLTGRAAEKLTDGLPRRSWESMTTCPREELEHPKRVHVDAFGHVHMCQGLSMGNMWETPLSELVTNYRAQDHPISGPLVNGGPAELARRYGITHDNEYVDECHFCYMLRKTIIDQFPQYLAPRLVYGFE
ncbi:MAG: hypothetical protein GF341_07835, partial [candidate division Zixibacteria bacterium]|nr:hypothetical protein [candidate division Zixibacteria bacterium]